MSRKDPVTHRRRPLATADRALLAVIATIAVLLALKASSSVTLPLGFALFIAVLAAPLQGLLSRRMPHGLAFTLTVLAVMAAFAAFVAGLAICFDEVAEGAERYSGALEGIKTGFEQLAGGLGIQAELSMDSVSGDQIGGALKKGATKAFGAAGGLILTTAFVVLALYEAPRWRRRLLMVMSDGKREAAGALLERLTTNFRRYLGTRTLTSGLTGVLTGLFTWAIGIDFAIVWAVSSWLLNYIPTLGSIVAIIPPALLAYVQHDSWAMALATVGGLGAIQLGLGSFVDPRLQSRFVDVSGLVVLISVALWGWVWGIPGALLGVPIAIGIILLSNESRSTRWLGELLSEEDD